MPLRSTIQAERTMRGQIFTKEEADRMVPLLRRIALNVRARARLLKKKRAEAAALSGGEREVRLAADIRHLAGQIEDLREEFESLGCMLQDAERGVVECFGTRDDDIVYLTWMPGRPAFDHWHPLDTPHDLARPIPPEEEPLPTG